MSTEFQEMHDLEILRIQQERQRASKNAGVRDPDEYRARLEAIDAEYQQELEKDPRYCMAFDACTRAQNTLADALARQSELQSSMHPQVGWQMQRRLAQVEYVKQCEQALAEKQQALNTIMNTIAREQYVKELEATHAQEQAKRDAEERQRIEVREGEIKGKLQAAWEGSPASFEEAWPHLKQRYLEDQAILHADAPLHGRAAQAAREAI